MIARTIAAAALAAAASVHAGNASVNLVTDGDFAAAAPAAGQYIYPASPTGTSGTRGGWTYVAKRYNASSPYNGDALVSAQGPSDWYGAAAPTGLTGSAANQFVALQRNSSLQQSVNLASAGLYLLTWYDAGRRTLPGNPAIGGNQTYTVGLANLGISQNFVTISDAASFTQHQFFISTGANADLADGLFFNGSQSTTTDQTAFIANVSLIYCGTNSCVAPSGARPALRFAALHPDTLPGAAAVPEPASWALVLTGFALTGTAVHRRRRSQAPA